MKATKPQAFRKPSRLNKTDPVRLQKYLANCGVGSRRACERMIEEGRVSIGGMPVVQAGVKIVPGQQQVTVDGVEVTPEASVYILLDKPRGYICSSHDECGRKTFHDLLPSFGVRLYSVGRLDRDSEGLLLVTNDGSLTARLTHPRHHVIKIYRVWTRDLLAESDVERLRQGVTCGGEQLNMLDIQPVRTTQVGGCYEIQLGEGRNRQIRRMFDTIEHPVLRLRRLAIGPLTDERLKLGEWRHLLPEEIAMLKQL